MNHPIIEVDGLSKQYRLGVVGGTTLRDDASRAWRKLRGRSTEAEPGDFWALRNVSFAVDPGEVVGILGHNGAGKSTLLKILSRITEPTRGRALLRGRTASLLEVGTGFHPDLTGRENVFLNGAILGMRHAEIQSRFDEIVAFANVAKFIDTPVKHYSSGMRVRLAFAVAAHLRSEILIVDEVLAVGDAAFQHKCLGTMKEIGSSGRTIIFVSHNVQFVSQLCSRCIVLARGEIDFEGSTNQGVERYLALQQLETTQAPGTAPIRIEQVRIHTSEPGNLQVTGKEMVIEIDLLHQEPLEGAAVSFMIINAYGHPATHLLLQDSEQPMCRHAGRTRLRCEISQLRLYPGRYHVDVFFAERPGLRKFTPRLNACAFEVIAPSRRTYYWQPHTAAYAEDCAWSVIGDKS